MTGPSNKDFSAYLRSPEARAIVQSHRVAAPPVVTSLPNNPADATEIEFLADAENGVRWRFRYNASSTSQYKWEFVGGTRMMNFRAGPDNTTSAAFVTLNGPSLIAPLTGLYTFVGQGVAFVNTANTEILIGFFVNGVRAGFSASGINAGRQYPIINADQDWHFENSGVPVVAGQVADIRYAQFGGGTGQYSDRWLWMLPERVG